MATTAELALLAMTKLRETLGRHGLELGKDKCTAYCPTPERVEGIREEMTEFVKWTPEGLVILETASDGEYRTEITTEARKFYEPTSGRLRNARMLADRIRQMCDTVHWWIELRPPSFCPTLAGARWGRTPPGGAVVSLCWLAAFIIA